MLTFPAAPLGADLIGTVYVNQDGDARLTGNAIDFGGDVDGFLTFYDDSGSLTAETTGGTDVLLAYYDGPGDPDVIDDDSGVGLNSRLSVGVSNRRLLTLAVRGFGSSTGDYGLNIDGPGHIGTQNISIDASNFGQAFGFIDAELDYDFYQFTTTAGGDWQVTVTPDGFWDPMLLVYDNAGNPVGGTFTSPIDTAGSGGSETWSGVDLTANQTYYLRVDGFAASTGAFEIEVQGASGGDPNDQISEALSASLGGSSTGVIDPDDDVDMYEFTVSAGQRVSFDIDRPSGSLDSWIRLFDASGNELAFNDDGAAPGEGFSFESYLEHTFSTGGTYFLGVSGYRNADYDAVLGSGDTTGSTGAYTLNISGMGSGGDSNDQLSEADGISIGGSQSGAVDSPEDVDMYEFFVSPGQRLSFDVDRPSGSLDSWLRLFDASGNEVAFNDDGVAPGESFTFESYLEHTFNNGGAYYVGVSGYRNADYDAVTGAGDSPGDIGDYTLNVTDITPDADVNDQIAEAISTTLGRVESGAIDTDEDVDMYAFTASAGSLVRLDIDRPSGSLDSWLRLFDANGNELAANDDGAAPGESFTFESYLEFILPASGTYYVGVSGYRNADYDAISGLGDRPGSTGAYTLTLEGPPANNDPNDQIGEAISTTVGGASQGVIDNDEDVDMYAFAATAGQTLSFDIDRPAGSLDSWLRLFDANGNQLASNDDGAALGESFSFESYLEFTFAQAGTYYVGVSGYRNADYNAVTGGSDVAGSTGDYSLLIADVGGQTDANDQITEAISTSVGVSRTGEIDSDEDVDMYSFTVSAGQAVSIDIDRPSGSLDSWIRLFDANGNQLASNDDGTGPTETPSFESYLEHTFTSAGTYYVGVSGYRNNAYNPVTGAGDVAGSTGAYELTLTDLNATNDDRFENNDTKAAVDARTAGAAGSPNLGLLTQRLELNNLAMADAADWFRFRIDRTGTAADVIRIEFNHGQGDLDMVVYRDDGTTIVGSSASTSNAEQVSLQGLSAGTYYVRVYGYNGATNPSYDLTIDPPTATGSGPQDYAVLFAGGYDRHNNHARYYNNIRDLYNTLVTRFSVPRHHIYILYADGTSSAIDRSDGLNSDMSYAAGAHVMSGTQSNLISTLSTLAQTVDGDDHFLFYSFDHGEGSENQPSTTGEERLTGWGNSINDEQLASSLQAINAGFSSYVFSQCFAGGMLDDLGALGSSAFGMAATNHYELSWGDGFARAFVDALNAGHVNTHDIYNYTHDNDPFAIARGTYTANAGVVQNQREHPWRIGGNFRIFSGSGNALGNSLSSGEDGANEPLSNAVPTVDSLTEAPASPVMVGAQVNLTATAQSPDGNAINKIIFYYDANNDGVAEDAEIIAIDANGGDGFNTSWDTKFVPAGQARILAVAEDSQFQRSPSRELLVTLTAGGDLPPIVNSFMTSPFSPITVGQAVTLSAAATDLGGGGVAKIAFYEDLNGNNMAEPAELIAVDSDGFDGFSVPWDTKFHATGAVTLLAVAEDLGGLRSVAAALGVTLVAQGGQAPVINSFTSDAGASVTIGAITTLSVTATDPDAGDMVSKVTFYVDINNNGAVDSADTIVAVDSDASNGWTASLDTKDFLAGPVTLLAVAEDSSLQSSAVATLTLQLVEPQVNQGPVVQSLTTAPASPIALNSLVTLAAAASDPDAGDSVVLVRFFEDIDGDGSGSVAQPVVELIGEDADPSDGFSIAWNTAGRGAGPVTLLAVAYDASNAASETFSLNVILGDSRRNPNNPGDVNGVGGVNTVDLLEIVTILRNNNGNPLNLNGPELPANLPAFPDPDGNNLVTVNDILEIVNIIRQSQAQAAGGELASQAEAASNLTFHGPLETDDEEELLATSPNLDDALSQIADDVHKARRALERALL